MIRVISAVTGVGTEVKLRDYSEPLQNQREMPSYASQFVYPIDFAVEPDYTNIAIYENEMIRVWRNMARNPYIDFAIDDIINEMISYTPEEKFPIKLDLNGTSFSKKIRDMIHEEWKNILKMLIFHRKCYTLLRDWYIDGKQYFFLNVKKGAGIKSITPLDPLRTKRCVSEDGKVSYVYQDIQLTNSLLEIPEDAIVELNSGLMDDKHNIWISYLHKAYIPLNQLNNIEDALLIYRIARAPERRVFYIDVGQLSKSKAETYMKEVIRNCRNKVEYDKQTGEIKESTLHMSLLDDIYLPRSADGRGTEVSTLQGGQQLGDLQDLDYFKMKLFRALNVPFTRWSEMNGPANVIGRTAELTRDEIKYRKFIFRLRTNYNSLFYIVLRKQLDLKKIVSAKEFDDEFENIMFEWSSDSMFAELRDIEILNERLNIVDRVAPYVGKYYSEKYVQQKVLRFSDEEIEEMKEDIQKEIEAGQIQNPQDTEPEDDEYADDMGVQQTYEPQDAEMDSEAKKIRGQLIDE